MGRLIKNAVKYAVVDGILSIDDLSYDNSFIKCKLTGSVCNVSCKYFDISSPCKYSVYECRCIFPGKLWFFVEVVQDRILDDRDFEYIIHTGKSLRNQDDINNKFNEFNSNIENAPVDKNDDIDVDDILLKIKDIYDKFTDNSRDNHIKNVTQILQKDNTAPKTVFNRMLDVANDVDFYKTINSNICINMIIDYIINGEQDEQKSKLVIDDIEIIIKFLFFAHVAKKGDFPYNQLIDENKMVKLIEKSTSLEDTHPCKWTRERIDKVLGEKDPYFRIVWFDNEFYSWYLYNFIYTDENNNKYNEKNITRFCILTKYILNIILLKLCFFYGSNYIIFNFYDNDNIINRLRIILSMIKLIYENQTKNSFSSLFLSGQKEYMYGLKKKIEEKSDLQSFRKIGENIVDINLKLEYLVKSDFLIKYDFNEFLNITT